MQIGYGWSFGTGDSAPVCDLEALASMGAERCFIVTDPADMALVLSQATGFLRHNDCLLVCSVTRLGETMGEIMDEAKSLGDIGAGLRILESSTMQGSISGSGMIELASAIARALETTVYATRSGEPGPPRYGEEPRGRGRPAALASEQHGRVRMLVAEHGLPVRQVARRFGVSAATIYRILAQA